MEDQYAMSVDPTVSDNLAAARLHVQALTACGLSREALLQALLESQTPDIPLSAFPVQTHALPTSFLDRDLPPMPLIHKSAIAMPPPQIAPAMLPPPAYAPSAPMAQVAHTRQHSRSKSTSRASKSKGPGTSSSATPAGATATTTTTGSTRAYWCTACDTKLARKFDWKRHMDEFHERYKKYPCPDCNRVFWGANTFNQHHRSAHGCATCPHADRVVRYVRRKRAWGCGFCAALLPTLDRYLEHVALHYESGKTRAHWSHARVIYGLLHQPGVHEAWRALVRERHGSGDGGEDLPKREQPHFSWDAGRTGHEQGFLENEAPGKLQDHLEFFDPLTNSARHLVELAYTQATVLTSSAVTMQQLTSSSSSRAVATTPASAKGRMSLPSTPQSKWVQSGGSRQTASVPQMAAADRDMLNRALMPISEETPSMFNVDCGSMSGQAKVIDPAGGAPPATEYLDFNLPDSLLLGLDMSLDDWSSMVSTVVDDTFSQEPLPCAGPGPAAEEPYDAAACQTPRLQDYFPAGEEQFIS